MAEDLSNISSGNVENSINDISGAVSDPFGTIIQKSLNKVNSLIVNVEKKTDQLIQVVVKKTDSKGRVSLQGNNLVITVTRSDAAEAQALKTQVEEKIKSIQKTLNILRTVINSLIAIQTAISVYKTVLDVQEALLTINPVSKATFTVLKKGIKIIFLKEILKQYLKLLKGQLETNKKVLNRLITRFRSIQVSVKITDEASTGNFINVDTAEALLADDLLGDGITSDSQDFTDNNFKEFILKVENYDKKQIIGRAYEKYSGMIKAQTAPSYFSTPEELMEELKNILNSPS